MIQKRWVSVFPHDPRMIFRYQTYRVSTHLCTDWTPIARLAAVKSWPFHWENDDNRDKPWVHWDSMFRQTHIFALRMLVSLPDFFTSFGSYLRPVLSRNTPRDPHYWIPRIQPMEMGQTEFCMTCPFRPFSPEDTSIQTITRIQHPFNLNLFLPGNCQIQHAAKSLRQCTLEWLHGIIQDVLPWPSVPRWAPKSVRKFENDTELSII